MAASAGDSDRIRQFVILAVVIAVGVSVVGSVFGAVAGTQSQDKQSFSDTLGIEEDTASLVGIEIEDVSVQQSLGQAVRLDGSQSSYLSGGGNVDVQGDFELATHVSIADQSANETQTVVSVGGSRMILYDASSDQWVGYFFDDDRDQTFIVRQDASDSSNLSHVALVHDGSHLTIIEDNNLSSSVAITDAQATTETVTARNLNGTLEETRLFDEALSTSQRQQLIDRPTAPLPGTQRELRVMFDSFDSSSNSFPAFFAGGEVAGDIQSVAGFAGESATAGDDYQQNGGTITTIDGGSLDGAPVLYASWAALGGVFVSLTQLGNLVGLAFRLGGMLLVALVARAILKRLQ